jgi:heme oxygenase
LSAHQQLRATTRDAHDRLDQLFSTLSLGDAADYKLFVMAHAAAFLAVEEALAAAGADRLLPDWNGLRRAEALRKDLADLDLALPVQEPAPDYASSAEVLGGLYVIEGSRLGGKLLRKAVASQFPARFLRSEAPPGYWRGFLTTMDRLLCTDDERRDAAKSAIRTFDCFEEAGRRILNR